MARGLLLSRYNSPLLFGVGLSLPCTDFLNKEARDYFADQYKLDVYKGSTLDTYTWNDMNEPSVFNGPEVTMAKDKMHGAVEHRDLHNMYGMLYTMATHQVFLGTHPLHSDLYDDRGTW